MKYTNFYIKNHMHVQYIDVSVHKKYKNAMHWVYYQLITLYNLHKPSARDEGKWLCTCRWTRRSGSSHCKPLFSIERWRSLQKDCFVLIHQSGEIAGCSFSNCSFIVLNYFCCLLDIKTLAIWGFGGILSRLEMFILVLLYHRLACRLKLNVHASTKTWLTD